MNELGWAHREGSYFMVMIGYLVRWLARTFNALGDTCNRLANFLYGLLPVLLSPSQLTGLLHEHYRTRYYSNAERPPSLNFQELSLDHWEISVLNRFNIHTGRMLVLGSGWGREAIAIARRGITVIGVDTSFVAVHAANKTAKQADIPAVFHQADFLKLPYAPASFNAVLLSSTMYSSIPGTTLRQAWLTDLGRLLTSDGLVILSFLPELASPASRSSLSSRMKARLAKFSSANAAYQQGDGCPWGHFVHRFQDEGEIQRELAGAVLVVHELNWVEGFVVASRNARSHTEAGFLDLMQVGGYPSLNASLPHRSTRGSQP